MCTQRLCQWQTVVTSSFNEVCYAGDRAGGNVGGQSAYRTHARCPILLVHIYGRFHDDGLLGLHT